MRTLDYFQSRLEATISPMDLLKAVETSPESYCLLDVRNGPEHLRQPKIKGAHVIPEQSLADRLEEVPRDREIIVYCWDVWCNTAAKAAAFLLQEGYKVKELSGGIAAWRTMDFPVETWREDEPGSCGC